MTDETVTMTFRRDELATLIGWYVGSHSEGDPAEEAASDALAERVKAAYHSALFERA